MCTIYLPISLKSQASSSYLPVFIFSDKKGNSLRDIPSCSGQFVPASSIYPKSRFLYQLLRSSSVKLVFFTYQNPAWFLNHCQPIHIDCFLPKYVRYVETLFWFKSFIYLLLAFSYLVLNDRFLLQFLFQPLVTYLYQFVILTNLYLLFSKVVYANKNDTDQVLRHVFLKFSKTSLSNKLLL